MSEHSDAHEPPRPMPPTSGWQPVPEPGQASSAQDAAKVPIPRPDYLRPNSVEHRNTVAVSNVLSSSKRTGIWMVPEHSTFRSLLGSVTLDLRQATLAAAVVTVHLDLMLASAKLVLPPRMRIELVPDTYLAEAKVKRRTRILPTDDDPVLRLTGTLIMSSVTIVQK